MFIYKSLCDSCFISLGLIPRSGVAGSCGTLLFNFLSNCQTDISNGCTSWHSHHQCTRVPTLPHSPNICDCLSLLVILVSVVVYLIVVLIWILLMTENVNFLCFYCPIIYLPWEISMQILWPFKNWVMCLFTIELYVYFIFCG